MKISVCMATYNGESFIKEQIDSILNQISSNDELIISDDGSTDGTISIINSYVDTRIKLYHFDQRNLILNFSNALQKASGDLIFLSDQDDIWKPDKVKIYVEKLKENTLVFSNASVFISPDIENNEVLFKESIWINNIIANIYKNKFVGATMAFRSSLLQKALPFPKDLPMHDIWLGLLAKCIGSTAYIEEPLIYYRRHNSNASATGERSMLPFSRKISYRFKLIQRLIQRLYLNK